LPFGLFAMNRAVIAVSTANRPDTLKRCIAAAIAGCNVAHEALWIVLDDSLAINRAATIDIIQAWRLQGLSIFYVDSTIEREIADSLPRASDREQLTHLTTRPESYRVTGTRNMALLTGLSLDPDVLFLLDDDVIHHHDRSCFFHWCVNY